MNVLKFSGVISHINVQQLNLHVTNHKENFCVKTPCQTTIFSQVASAWNLEKKGQ